MKIGKKKNKTFYKKYYEKCDLKTSSRPFLIFKEYPVKRNLWRSVSADLDKFW